MNCKQGDLAMVVRSFAGNEGRIVRCIRLVLGQQFGNPETNEIDFEADAWEVEPPLNGLYGGLPAYFAVDSYLRPIRDNEDQDETLTWAGKPQKEKA